MRLSAIWFIRINLLQNLAVIANVSSGTPEKKGNDVIFNIENQQGCHAEPVEAQAS